MLHKETPLFEKVVLERIKLGVKAFIDKHYAEQYFPRIDTNVETDYLTEQLMVQLTTSIAGGRRHEQILDNTYVPLTWWDAFKERWFPQWALRYPFRPVQSRRIVTKMLVQNTCPHISDIFDKTNRMDAHIAFLGKIPE
jgi:hypothetical protein